MRDVRGRIFDIQRNSYVDGPGIRTTIFLKGCNLRCLWCHNPEGIQTVRQYVHFSANCVRCGQCVRLCPENALREIRKPDLEKCLMCGKCALYCPKSAIRIYGQDVTAGEMVDLIIRDRVFYETSGGGVTFSGGECMRQMDFLSAMLKLCVQAGIRTALDTAGNVPQSDFERVEPDTDIFLYDIKAIRPDVHRRLTGADNQQILENLRWLLETCPDKVYIRIPVIPGANDTENDSEIPFIARYLRDLQAPKEVVLLPYHRLGEGKRNALGMKNFFSRVPDTDHMMWLNGFFHHE